MINAEQKQEVIRRLVTENEAQKLRWTLRPGASIRAYECGAQSGFCVSTRSSELTFVLEGELVTEMGPASQQVITRPGDAVLVLRGTPHKVHTQPGTRMLVIDICSEPSLGLGIASIPSGQISSSTDRLVADLWEGASLESVADQELLAQMRCLMSRGLIDLEQAHDTRRVLGVKALLEGSYAATPRLGEIARSLNMDRYYLVRSFKRNFGAPPADYLHFLRMEHFVWSLMRGYGVPMTERSLDAGYKDYSTFCRRIRKIFGKPPSALVEMQALGA